MKKRIRVGTGQNVYVPSKIKLELKLNPYTSTAHPCEQKERFGNIAMTVTLPLRRPPRLVSQKSWIDNPLRRRRCVKHTMTYHWMI